VSGLALLFGLYVIGLWLAASPLVAGWSSTIVVVSFLCGVNMLMTGIMGLYIGRIHAEVKRRPLYVVTTSVGFDNSVGRTASADTTAGVRDRMGGMRAAR
jgi:dolichol-phosphate mannosyltransferase